MSAHTDLAAKQAAKYCANRIIRVVDAIVSQMELAASMGEDPNKLREVARDLLMEKAGFSVLQAANIVRLAVQKFNLKHAGVDTYGDDLHEIVSIIAGARCLGTGKSTPRSDTVIT